MKLSAPPALTILQAAETYREAVGVYLITHQNTGLSYVGQSLDVGRRLLRHLHDLQEGTHPSPRLQDAWNAAKGIGFTADLWDSCTPAELLVREAKALRHFSKAINEVGEQDTIPLNEKNRFRRSMTKPRPRKVSMPARHALAKLNVRADADGHSVTTMLLKLLEAK